MSPANRTPCNTLFDQGGGKTALQQWRFQTLVCTKDRLLILTYKAAAVYLGASSGRHPWPTYISEVYDRYMLWRVCLPGCRQHVLLQGSSEFICNRAQLTGSALGVVHVCIILYSLKFVTIEHKMPFEVHSFAAPEQSLLRQASTSVVALAYLNAALVLSRESWKIFCTFFSKSFGAFGTSGKLELELQ